jgi:hypothetical protein
MLLSPGIRDTNKATALPSVSPTARVAPMERDEAFVAEGKMEVGPMERYFI